MTGPAITADQPARRLGDYAHVDQADAENLVDRLDAMRTLDMFTVYKAETVALMRLAEGMAAADVGCGTGDDAATIARAVGPQGESIGLDLSEAMIAEARARHAGQTNLRFVQAPADALGLADASLDAIRADRVLLHVPDARAALAEMVRVVKPGGRVVVSEPDMLGCWVASDDPATVGRVLGAIAHSCATPTLPRDLWTMFRDAGLADVTLEVRAVTVFDPRPVERILEFRTVIAALLAKKLMGEAEAERFQAEMAERGAQGRFASALPIMIVAGTKA